MSGELSGYTLPVHSLESFGVHDGPGIRFIIFTQGCGFRCAYCHNPDTISAEGGHQTELEEIARLIMNSKAYFGNKGGVTVSGGEALIHAGKLIPLFRFLKKEGINTALDTNGNFMNADVEELLGLTDLVLLDVKHIDPAKHKLLKKTWRIGAGIFPDMATSLAWKYCHIIVWVFTNGKNWAWITALRMFPYPTKKHWPRQRRYFQDIFPT